MPGGGGTQVEADGTPREHAAHCVDVDRGLKIIKIPTVLQFFLFFSGNILQGDPIPGEPRLG